jgi:histidine triad (HIT) family protein
VSEPACSHGNDRATCDACYAEDVADVLRPVVPLGQALAELEATDPEVAAAAKQLDDLWRVRRPTTRSSACPFCAIVAAAPARIVHEWPDTLAFEPLNPVTPGHVLVIPKAHVADFRTDPTVSATVMARAARLAAVTIGHDVNLITSAGADATQTVRHLHIHLVPRRAGDGLALPWTGQR